MFTITLGVKPLLLSWCPREVIHYLNYCLALSLILRVLFDIRLIDLGQGALLMMLSLLVPALLAEWESYWTPLKMPVRWVLTIANREVLPLRNLLGTTTERRRREAVRRVAVLWHLYPAQPAYAAGRPHVAVLVAFVDTWVHFILQIIICILYLVQLNLIIVVIAQVDVLERTWIHTAFNWQLERVLPFEN